MNITIYAASSGQVPEVYKQAAAELGTLLVRRGHTLVNGAGCTGLMGATTDAVLAAGGRAIGVIPQFMLEQNWQHTGMSRLIVTPDMHSRKETMAAQSDACIACPVGWGRSKNCSKSSLGSNSDFMENPSSFSTRPTSSHRCWNSSAAAPMSTSCAPSTTKFGKWRPHLSKPSAFAKRRPIGTTLCGSLPLSETKLPKPTP